MVKCKICGKEYNDKGIGIHIKTQHNMKPQEYYDKYIGKHYCPICSKETTFRSIHQGYLTYCSIHCANLDNSIFITNNPQSNSEIKKRTLETFSKNHNGAKTPFQIKEIHKKATDRNHTEDTLEKRTSSLYSNINAFCKENNCITLEEAMQINPCNGWWSEVDFIIYKKWRKFVSLSDINFIKNYKPYIGKSKKEEKLYELIKKRFNGEIIHCDRNEIKPFEIDIYIPEKHIGIEYNGTYWHSIERNRHKDHILKKSLLCRNKNIRLIHIYDFEDLDSQIELLLDLIINGIDNYPKNDFNKNNLLMSIPKSTIIYKDTNTTLYGAGKLY